MLLEVPLQWPLRHDNHRFPRGDGGCVEFRVSDKPGWWPEQFPFAHSCLGLPMGGAVNGGFGPTGVLEKRWLSKIEGELTAHGFARSADILKERIGVHEGPKGVSASVLRCFLVTRPAFMPRRPQP